MIGSDNPDQPCVLSNWKKHYKTQARVQVLSELNLLGDPAILVRAFGKKKYSKVKISLLLGESILERFDHFGTVRFDLTAKTTQ